MKIAIVTYDAIGRWRLVLNATHEKTRGKMKEMQANDASARNIDEIDARKA